MCFNLPIYSFIYIFFLMFVYSFSPRIGQISETSCHCYVTSTSGLPCVDDPNSSPSLLCRCTVPWCTDSLTPCPLAVLQDSHGGELNETFKDNARHFSRIFHPSKEVVGYFAFFSPLMGLCWHF